MSRNSTTSGSKAAQCEEFDEETQETISGTKKSAQIKTRQSRKDERSDSGYSSQTAATQSTSGSSKGLGFFTKMTGGKKSSSSKTTASPEKTRKPEKSVKGKGLKLDTNIESREDAARIQLSGVPLQRTTSARSLETSTRLPRTTDPSPTQPQPIPRAIPPGRASMSRPQSYHAGAGSGGYSFPAHVVQFAAPLQMNYAPVHMVPAQHYRPPPPQQQHYTHIMPSPLPMSPSRQTAYPFPATVPPQYLTTSPVAGWESQYQPQYTQPIPSQPAAQRRNSMAGPPIVSYPMIPHRVPPQRSIEHSRPPSSYQQSTMYTNAVDEGVFLEENEAYYRQQEQARARLAMPPPPAPQPQRPVMRHANTTSDAVKRVNRHSLERMPRTSTSSRTESFSSLKEEVKPPLLSRSSSSRNIPIRAAEMPSSPEHPRRSRPQSMHSGIEKETIAEQYQATKRGSAEPQALTAEAVKKVGKSSKTHKSKTSETGSRSSGSKRRSEEAKKRQSKPSNDNVSVEVSEGCAATFTRTAKGDLAVFVRPSEEAKAKARAGREREREDARESRRYSISNRRESGGTLEALARSIMARQPSSTHPTVRRPKIDPHVEVVTGKGMTERVRDVDETAVEDDEYSEPEIRKKRSEKPSSQRMKTLRPPGPTESRQSSRSGRSVKSERSNTSKRRIVPVEGEPF